MVPWVHCEQDVADLSGDTERTDADWVELRLALAHVRIAAKLGENPDPAVEQIETTAAAHAGVSAANTGLDNLPTVQLGWDAGLSG